MHLTCIEHAFYRTSFVHIPCTFLCIVSHSHCFVHLHIISHSHCLVHLLFVSHSCFLAHRTFLCTHAFLRIALSCALALSCTSHFLVHSCFLAHRTFLCTCAFLCTRAFLCIRAFLLIALSCALSGLGDLKSSKSAIPLVFVVPERLPVVCYSHLPMFAVSS